MMSGGDRPMRLWSLHPRYLDPQGLVAVWREGLLAQAVLRDQTKGYRHHPQLKRFRAHRAPRRAINAYLVGVLEEASSRGYSFDGRKAGPSRGRVKLTVTRGQLAYEWKHLLRKLRVRSPESYRRWKDVKTPRSHPIFTVVAGPMEPWERPRYSTFAGNELRS
jgi:hypothetical protein